MRLCARHWREAREAERVEAARLDLAKLFGVSRPRIARSRGASLATLPVTPHAAMPARIGANGKEAMAWL